MAQEATGKTYRTTEPPGDRPAGWISLGGLLAGAFAYIGTVSLFSRAGFTEVTRPSPERPILRPAL